MDGCGTAYVGAAAARWNGYSITSRRDLLKEKGFEEVMAERAFAQLPATIRVTLIEEAKDAAS